MSKVVRPAVCLCLLLLIPLRFDAQVPPPAAEAALRISGEDLRIEQRVDGGYHLFIRKKPGISSVLLVESTKDPTRKADNYAYRAASRNPVNGDEKRLLDGKFIEPERGIYSLIDSTAEADAAFGEAFHIWIPYLIYYGYPWSRNGEVYVVDGTYFNIRAFSRPFGDYSGAFLDNPFVVKVAQNPLPGPPEGNFMADTVDAFERIAERSRSELVWSTGESDVIPKIRSILERAKGRSVDLVLALDTTASMKNDIDSVREQLIPMLRGMIDSFSSFRVGLVLYKDYLDEYVTRTAEFTTDFGRFQRSLNAIRVRGGRDLPEAVYEALYAAAVEFDWQAQERIVILIGDAPPHPRQMGKVSEEMVTRATERLGLRVNVIILPQ